MGDILCKVFNILRLIIFQTAKVNVVREKIIFGTRHSQVHFFCVESEPNLAVEKTNNYPLRAGDV